MKWVDDWPVIGIDKDEDGCGEPVLFYKKPDVYKRQGYAGEAGHTIIGFGEL